MTSPRNWILSLRMYLCNGTSSIHTNRLIRHFDFSRFVFNFQGVLPPNSYLALHHQAIVFFSAAKILFKWVVNRNQCIIRRGFLQYVQMFGIEQINCAILVQVTSEVRNGKSSASLSAKTAQRYLYHLTSIWNLSRTAVEQLNCPQTTTWSCISPEWFKLGTSVQKNS